MTDRRRELILYHQGCADGFGAAWAAWKRLGDAADYRPCSHTDRPPDVRGRRVTLVDFAWPRATLLEMAEDAASLLVLDHHKTAEEDLRGLPFARFDLGRSGAVIAWEHWHDEPVPELLRYVQDKDLWRWELPESEEVSAALQSQPFDFAVWDGLDVARLREDGRAILRFQRRLVEEIAGQAGRLRVAGHDVPAVNAPVLQSYVGNRLAPGEAFALVWYELADGRRRCSLRASPPAGVDVAEIAARFGGGGHPAAAGFVLPAPADAGAFERMLNPEP